MQQTTSSSKSLAGTGAYAPLTSWTFVTGLGVTIVGLCMMIGWFLGRESLQRLAPGLSTPVVVASVGVAAVAFLGVAKVSRLHVARVLVNVRLQELNSSLQTHIDERTTELETSNALARALTGAAAIGIFHADTEGRCTYVNERWCDIYRTSVEDALKDGWTRGLQTEERERVLEDWTKASAAGVDFEVELRVELPAGEISWVHVHCARMLDVGGSLVGYVGTVEDVALRRTVQHAVRNSEELFRIMFGSSAVGMALVDADGLIVRANHALSELTYYTLDELVTMRLQSIVHPDLADVAERGKGTESHDQRIVRADGSVCWWSIRYAQIARDGAGNPALTIVQFVDTSERRQFEEQLALMANHDFLTGLSNRRSFETALNSHVAYCRRYGPIGAVLMLDLDHFVRINDKHGHDVGNQAIVTIAHLLRQRVRASDLVARLGGDKFVVLLPAGHGAGARAVAQILVEEINSNSATIAGDEIALTVSIGVAVFDDIDRSADEILVNAGLAMYDAKDLGGDRWAQFATEKYGERRFRPDSLRSTGSPETSQSQLELLVD